MQLSKIWQNKIIFQEHFCNKITLDDADKDQVELSIKIID